MDLLSEEFFLQEDERAAIKAMEEEEERIAELERQVNGRFQSVNLRMYIICAYKC